MAIEDLLTDRSKMMKLFWIGLVASMVFIAIGTVIILLALVG